MTDEPNFLGKIKDKLIGKKQEWAAQGRGLTGEAAPHEQRLPPGQHLVKDWPVLDLGIQPQILTTSYTLTLDGAVEHPMILSWADLMGLPQSETVSDMHCVTTWSRYDNKWRGVSAEALLTLVQPLVDCRHIIFHAHDDYTTNVRLEQFAQDDCLLVHTWNDAPITREHGGPLRVMIPKFYLWKSAKWVKRLEFVAVDAPGFWETRGYNNNADPWHEERYS
ncbi:MAG: sulfite oxidase-like oxidoreductase [Acidocella sp.]|nr:sulfite oxidase-like oxidoreductase [Acidocella sp.]